MCFTKNTLSSQKKCGSKEWQQLAIVAVIATIILLVLFIALTSQVLQNVQEEITSVRWEQDGSARAVTTWLASEFDRAFGNVRFLRNHVKRHITNVCGGSQLNSMDECQAGKDEFAQIAQDLAAISEDYLQIRYLNESGHEFVRVNYHGDTDETILVPENELQDKKDSYYFEVVIKETRALDPDAIYVSRWDLNKEHGEVEVPHEDTLRFSSQVTDSAGNFRGIVVCNFRAKSARQQLREIVGTPFHLLDDSGNWIIHPEGKDKEFLFMFEQENTYTFEDEQPKIWSMIQADDNTQEIIHGTDEDRIVTYGHFQHESETTYTGPTITFVMIGSVSEARSTSQLIISLAAVVAIIILAAIIVWRRHGIRRSNLVAKLAESGGVTDDAVKEVLLELQKDYTDCADVDECIRRAKELGDIRNVKPRHHSFKEIMKDHLALSFFLRYVSERYAPEGVMFARDIDLLRDLTSHLRKRIYLHYVKPSSTLELNLTIDTRQEIARIIEMDAPIETGLEAVEKEAIGILETNYHASFLRSDLFMYYLLLKKDGAASQSLSESLNLDESSISVKDPTSKSDVPEEKCKSN